ncbi:hypothetical protein QJS10_CPA05g02050 [Acorus calamus]|uniref:BSD domain-containing protein n=1 Tax=Acorus calamus TaxID=4465 RepID=A0AAV9EV47_ACOCL|nr:hypothetical protein QJS10_CPA05g02050 [Acorus calamus]
MDLWTRAKVFAEEAAKRSSEISKEAAKRSQELTKDLVSETSKRSLREFAAEASKRADAIRSEALKLAADIPSKIPIPPLPMPSPSPSVETADLEIFGVTEELREFVKGITLNTFRDFPMEDEPEISEVPTVSNVRQDLNEWQAKHATLVLSSVKEISKFRYELCPRHMKERKFWRIYFILVDSHVAPYEKQYMEEVKLKSAQQKQEDEVKEISTEGSTSEAGVSEKPETKLHSRTSASSTKEQDLDVFLLGDLGSDDEGPDNGDDDDDEDFDKMLDNSGIESEDDK